MEPRRRRRRQTNKTNQLLIGLIAVLAVMLVVSLIVALFLGGDQTPDETTGGTAAPGSTTVPPQTTIAPTTEPTTVPTTAEKLLEFTVAPESPEITTMEGKLRFEGNSDPNAALTLNGEDVAREEDGSFALEKELTSGANTFVFAHKEQEITYTVNYRYTVQSYFPDAAQSYNSGATVYFEVVAREGSSVTAQFNGGTYTLSESANQQGSSAMEGFRVYTGSCGLTNLNTSDLALGHIVYTVTCNGVTETYSSGDITCLKSTQILASDPSVTPSGGRYMDVGSGYIVEIINYSAETFNGRTVDDYSNPTWNYLPQGTLDYGSTQQVYANKFYFMQLRSGQRVYVKKDNPPAAQTTVVDCYTGKLPDHNEIGVAAFTESDRYLELTLDTMWKAPFYLDMLPQAYNNPGNRDFRVSECTYEYIEITFCYATVFDKVPELPAGNPLFSKAELIDNGYDHTLRLYLKQVGKFYGWDAEFNAAGQLCFKFLKPPKAVAAENAYGVDLTGMTVMIDVGHGGKDGGATKYAADGTRVTEASLNLRLSLKVKAELESVGATVVMNRSDNSTVTVDERIKLMRRVSPDFHIAIHHNSNASSDPAGFGSYYFNAFSKQAAQMVYDRTRDAGIYTGHSLRWHVYYMCRQTFCPSMLTENGYMSNPSDLAAAIDDSVMEAKAKAIAQGIADYFLANSIS